MNAIEVKAVRRRYGRLEALRGVDLELETGVTLALLGPNGAGKTTLLKVVAGLVRPHAGSVAVFGLSLAREREAVLSRLGLLTHQPLLYEALTAFENLSFFARLYGLETPRDAVSEALERVALPASKWHVPVRELSRGLTQRVALGRALVHEPELLILDEPYSGLDPEAAHTLAGVLAAHRESGRSALVTTHHLERAFAMADELAVLARGRVAWSGAKRALSFGELERAYADAARSS